MNPIQSSAFHHELALANEFISNGQLEAGFAHLERAHIIGQAFVVPHATTHWLMLKVELRRRSTGAVIGQVLRLALGTLGSAVGIVPTGNTGGTNINMFKRIPIDAQTQAIIDGVQSKPLE